MISTVTPFSIGVVTDNTEVGLTDLNDKYLILCFFQLLAEMDFLKCKTNGLFKLENQFPGIWYRRPKQRLSSTLPSATLLIVDTIRESARVTDIDGFLTNLKISVKPLALVLCF